MGPSELRMSSMSASPLAFVFAEGLMGTSLDFTQLTRLRGLNRAFCAMYDATWEAAWRARSHYLLTCIMESSMRAGAHEELSSVLQLAVVFGKTAQVRELLLRKQSSPIDLSHNLSRSINLSHTD